MQGKKKKIKNKLELISLHIPKTAGTSFRNILKEAYGDDHVVRFDIHRDPLRIRVEEKLLSRNKISREIRVIHGHFKYLDLLEHVDIKPDIPVITWLRNPVDRVISNYYYLSKRLKEELDEEGKGLNILAKMQKSLMEYAQTEMNRNRISKFLEGISLEEMKFVGIQEYFDEDLIYFCHLFGIKNIQPLKQNVTGKKYSVDKETRDEIARLNMRDMEIFKKGIELRNQRNKIDIP